MNRQIRINRHGVGPGMPVYIVAEMSANHGQDLDQAIKTVAAAAEAGADAIKVQTYTPDTLTIDCDNEHFRIKGTLWDGRTLYDLYSEACLPWDWHARLKAVADDLGLDFFSTPFDASAVDLLEALGVPAYKIASFEVVDVPLLTRVARTGKPVVLSTGMATLGEIDEAVQVIAEAGGSQLALLKCTSAYPAPMDGMNLRTIPHLAAAYGVPVGLSDHSLGITAPITAVALGAGIVEKHFALSRDLPGPDSAFSLDPSEFRLMVQAVRDAERCLGEVCYGAAPQEAASLGLRRSLFVVEDMHAGDEFTPENVRSIRPSGGLHPRHLGDILGRRARCDIRRGTPVQWSMVS